MLIQKLNESKKWYMKYINFTFILEVIVKFVMNIKELYV